MLLYPPEQVMDFLLSLFQVILKSHCSSRMMDSDPGYYVFFFEQHIIQQEFLFLTIAIPSTFSFYHEIVSLFDYIKYF